MIFLISYKVKFPKTLNNLIFFRFINKNLFEQADQARKKETTLNQLHSLLFQEQKSIIKQSNLFNRKFTKHKRVQSDFIQNKFTNKNFDQCINDITNFDQDCLTLQPQILTSRYDNDSFFQDIDQTRLGNSFMRPIDKNKDNFINKQQDHISSFQNLQLLQYSKNFTFVKNLTGHLDSIRTVNFLNQDSIITCGEDGLIQVHSFLNKYKQKIRIKGIPLSSVLYQNYFFTANHKGLVNCYQIKKDKLNLLNTQQTIEQEPIWSLFIQNNLLCSTSPDFIKFWQINQQDFNQIQNWRAKEKNFVQSELYNNTLWNSFCYKANKSKSFFQQLDLETQQLIQVIESENNFSNNFKILQEKNILLSGNDDNSISIFDIKSGKMIKSFKAHQDQVSCIDVNSQHGLIVSGGDDDSVRLWDLKNLRCGGESSLHCQKFNKSIFDIKFHNTLKAVVTAGADHTSKVFYFN